MEKDPGRYCLSVQVSLPPAQHRYACLSTRHTFIQTRDQEDFASSAITVTSRRRSGLREGASTLSLLPPAEFQNASEPSESSSSAQKVTKLPSEHSVSDNLWRSRHMPSTSTGVIREPLRATTKTGTEESLSFYYPYLNHLSLFNNNRLSIVSR